jgi:hypothetical protein
MKYGLTIAGTVLGFFMASSGVMSKDVKSKLCEQGYKLCPGDGCIPNNQTCNPANIVHFTPVPDTIYALPERMGFFCGTKENPQAPQKVTIPNGELSEYWICPTSSEPSPKSKSSQEKGSEKKSYLEE